MKNMLILLGIVFVVLMLVFHRNPMEELIKKRQERLKGKDPLILSIEEYNANKNKLGGILHAPKINSDDDSDGPGASPAPPPGAIGTSSMNGLMHNNPYVQTPQEVAPVPTPAPNAGYYPPPPLNQIAPQQAPLNPNSPYGKHSSNDDFGIYLRSGQKIAFAGIKVFTVDADGNKKPMPDGIYPLKNARFVMTVKDGNKIVLDQLSFPGVSTGIISGVFSAQ